MSRVTEIVDSLLESEDSDMEDFAREAGVLSPGLQAAEAFDAALSAKRLQMQRDPPVKKWSSANWFNTPLLRYGICSYAVFSNLFSGRTICRCDLMLPDAVVSEFDILRSYGGPVHVRSAVTTGQNADAVRVGIDSLHNWSLRQLQKWDDLAFIRRTFKRIEGHDLGGSVNLEFRQKFKHGPMVYWASTGIAASPIPAPKAARMRAWLQARLPQLGIAEAEEGAMTEVDFEAFARDAGVLVTMDDFLLNSYAQRTCGYSNGNYVYSVSYKRLLHKGRPVYLGSVTACSDYRNERGGKTAYYVDVPSRMWTYDPRDAKGRRVLKNPKSRQNYGYGAVHMAKPSVHEFDSLYDACKHLLSLLKVQHPLRRAGVA